MGDEITRTILLDNGTRALRLRSFRLVALAANGSRIGAVAEFSQRRVTIGTSPDNDLVLDDPTVSRQHAEIEVDAAGYRLRDLDSKNGTRIGEVRIREAFLVPGATFSIGDTRVRFEPTEDEVEVRFSGANRFGRMVGQSLLMREVFGLLERVSPSDATILVTGRSGTGKELVAEAVHDHSPRRKGPFMVVDCSAVPRDLIESELFGHAKGSFTGAIANRKGAFEQASGGTLFLDELGELPSDLQPKLLRALERREVRRVGTNEPVPIDVRVVAATNRNLREEVARGSFREDLYYRLAVVQVHLPSLRDRPDDIPLLADHFLRESCKGREPMNISYQTMERLRRHEWPGNVRELRNFIERAVLLSSGGEVDGSFLDIGEGPRVRTPSEALVVDCEIPFKDAKARLLEEFERAYWVKLMEQCGGNLSAAARTAGMHRRGVEYALRRLDLSRADWLDGD